jgi:hypothetical protein
MPIEHLAQKPFGGSQIAPLAEPELDRVAVAINSTIEMHPAVFDLDAGPVREPSPGESPLTPIELIKKFGEYRTTQRCTVA